MTKEKKKLVVGVDKIKKAKAVATAIIKFRRPSEKIGDAAFKELAKTFLSVVTASEELAQCWKEEKKPTAKKPAKIAKEKLVIKSAK